MNKPALRPADFDDAAQITDLANQLGYRITEEQIICSLAELNQQPNDAVFVAEIEDIGVIGWMHVHIHRSLLNNPVALLDGLIVDKAYRNQSIGAQLLTHAELWAQTRGCAALWVKSNITRERAHTFYEKNGYRHIKSQHVFVKTL